MTRGRDWKASADLATHPAARDSPVRPRAPIMDLSALRR